MPSSLAAVAGRRLAAGAGRRRAVGVASCTWRPGRWRSRFCFGFFASAALVCAVLMITSRNPVYAALWFALVTLSTCGLFLLQSAPFLAAATIIVYAGAIVVTFVFVIMLAQQSGATIYDQRSRQPLVATIVAFVLLGRAAVHAARCGTRNDARGRRRSSRRPRCTTNELSRPPADEPIGTMHGLGRSLFGDYLFAVELAGTLLLDRHRSARLRSRRGGAEGTL